MWITFEDKIHHFTSSRVYSGHKPHPSIEDLEFGEGGRDPRFLPGWFLIPTLALGVIVAIFVSLLM